MRKETAIIIAFFVVVILAVMCIVFAPLPPALRSWLDAPPSESDAAIALVILVVLLLAR